MNGPSLYDDPTEFYRPVKRWGHFAWLLDLITITAALILLAIINVVDAVRWVGGKVRNLLAPEAK